MIVFNFTDDKFDDEVDELFDDFDWEIIVQDEKVLSVKYELPLHILMDV